MRYAIVSDLHANVQAWNAVLTDLGSSAVDRILCLGDVVGYGPDPAAVLASVHRHVHALVLGNHDAVVCGKMSPEAFNARARQLILWTRTQVGRAARDFLGELPLTLRAPGFRCVHGTFANPAAFDYLVEPEDAAASWRSVPEPLLFVGHSHTPGLFVLGASGVPHKLDPQDFALEPGKRYIVNVGSVGSPRDGDARASYVLFDEASGSVLFRRIPFDLDAFRQSVVAAGLDPEDVPSLRSDPRRRLAPVREGLDFSPAERTADEVRNVVVVAEVERLVRRSTARWRRRTAAALLLAAGGTAGAFLLARADRPRPLVVPGEEPEAVGMAIPAGGAGNYLPTLPDAVGADGGIRPWRIFHGDRRTQSVAVLPEEAPQATRRLLLRSTDAEIPLRIEAPPLLLDDGDRKLTLLGEIRRREGFEGHVGLVLDLLRTDASGEGDWVPQYQTVEFRALRGGALERAQKTDTIPKYARAVRVVLEGAFRGEVELHALRLTRGVPPQTAAAP